MIAFVQPWSIHGPGGGPRILRSLLQDPPTSYVSIFASPFPETETSHEDEIRIPRRPYLGDLPEWVNQRIGNPFEYLTLALSNQFESRLLATLKKHEVQAVHSIPQGIEYWNTFRVARKLGIPFYFNVHDDLSYNLRNFPYRDRAMQHLGTVWREADECIVISEAMGDEYNRRYGERSYLVVTDGLASIAAHPKSVPSTRRRIYFMGSVHTSYENNFKSLVAALGRLQHKGYKASLTVRGGIPFELDPGSVPLHRLPWGSQEDVKADLEAADMLYLPLPFEPQFDDFVRLSLSTKLVTYVGSGVPIVYHGPSHSAAGRLLDQHNGCLMADQPDAASLVKAITQSPDQSEAVAERALELADDRFRIKDQRSRFWSILQPAASPTIT